ncbi:thioesterase family protein [Nocardia thailandica]
MESSYFLRRGPHRFAPTAAVGGAWADDEQHFSPVAGLAVHEIERHRAREGRPAIPLGRVTFDILGRIMFTEFEIHVETLRPGRTIELVQATVVIGGRPAVTARAWYLAPLDTAAVAGGAADPLPAPGTLPTGTLSERWPGGYIASLDSRVATGYRPGRAALWLRAVPALIADEPVTDLVRFTALIDTANGIAVRRDPREWLFPNIDLTVHLHRQPTGPWVGLDTSVVFGETGQGLTSTVLHDLDGPVGRAEQILTVRPQLARIRG